MSQGRRVGDRTVAAIVGAKKEGDTNTEIARAFGLALRTVGRILEREGFRSKYGPKKKTAKKFNEGRRAP